MISWIASTIFGVHYPLRNIRICQTVLRRRLPLWFIATHINAATLTCTGFIADSLSSRHPQFGTELIFATMHELETMHAYINRVHVSMPLHASHALAGMWIRLGVSDPGLAHFTVYAEAQVVSGQMQYTLAATTNARPEYNILSLYFTGNLQHLVPTPTLSSDIKVTHDITGGIYDHIQAETLLLHSVQEDTDAISIPDAVDLGLLNHGHNQFDDLMQYSKNTNSIGMKFTSNTTKDASFTVNNEVAQSGTVYKPPFNLGMFVESGAKPGTYTSNVNATWTCP